LRSGLCLEVGIMRCVDDMRGEVAMRGRFKQHKLRQAVWFMSQSQLARAMPPTYTYLFRRPPRVKRGQPLGLLP
jgi:hypothetical protein